MGICGSKKPKPAPISAGAFTIKGKYDAFVVRVIDGDTFEADMKVFEQFNTFRFRMLLYNSPELHPPKDDPKRDEIIAKANEAKDKLTELIGGKWVKVDCEKFDAFGRILAWCRAGNLDVNKWMLENKYGVLYHKKTKAERKEEKDE